MTKTVMIGTTPIGQGHPTVLMPEIGVLFKQDVGLARRNIELVKEADCPIIKGEIYHTADIVADDGFMYSYKTHQGTQTCNYRQFIESVVLPEKTWRELFGMCHDLGMATVVSAYDTRAIDILADIGVACVKVASNHAINIPLLRHAAKSGMAVMMDTGKTNLDDVARAVMTVRDAGCDNLIVNHTPDGHPCPASEHHLRIIETYQAAFDCPIGLSDHYQGEEILYAAAALGYAILEKPVVPDPLIADWGALWSMPLSRISSVKAGVEACWTARGQTYKSHVFHDRDYHGRAGLVAARAINAGEMVTSENTRFAYPRHGISVRYWDIVEGAVYTRDIGTDQPVTWDDVKISA